MEPSFPYAHCFFITGNLFFWAFLEYFELGASGSLCLELGEESTFLQDLDATLAVSGEGEELGCGEATLN